MKLLLVPTDFSPISDNATKFAMDMAKAMGAKIMLVNMYQIPISFSEVPLVTISLDQLKNGEFTPEPVSDIARSTFTTRELALDEQIELSFGRPLTSNPTDAIYAAMSGDNQLIALLANKEGMGPKGLPK